MIVTKKEPTLAPYARKEAYEYEGKQYEADIQNGDIVTIKNPGELVTGQYGEQHEFLIATRNGDKMANFNQSSINVLHDAFGADTAQWVGKQVNVLTKKGMFGGKKAIAAYFVSDGWYLDEFGDLVKAGSEPTTPEPVIQVDAMPDDVREAQARDLSPDEMPTI